MECFLTYVDSRVAGSGVCVCVCGGVSFRWVVPRLPVGLRQGALLPLPLPPTALASFAFLEFTSLSPCLLPVHSPAVSSAGTPAHPLPTACPPWSSPPRGLADQPWLIRIGPSVSVLCPLLQPKVQHARGTSVVFPLLPRGTGACSVSAVRGDGHAEGALARRGAGTEVVAGLP